MGGRMRCCCCHAACAAPALTPGWGALGVLGGVGPGWLVMTGMRVGPGWCHPCACCFSRAGFRGFRPPVWDLGGQQCSWEASRSKAGPAMRVLAWGGGDALASCWCPSPRNTQEVALVVGQSPQLCPVPPFLS